MYTIVSKVKLRLPPSRSSASVHIAVDDVVADRVGGGEARPLSGARNRLPLFLRETPHDTGVTRGVKRAATSLDALGIKIGVFFRRYPIARYDAREGEGEWVRL